MAVQSPVINVTTVAGLLGIVANNAAQQTADEAALLALQNQVTNILSKSASAPGSYSPPGAAGAQVYSAKTTPWTSAATQVGALLMSVAVASPTVVFYDVWDAANLVDIAVSYNTANASGTVYRIQRTASGKPTIISSISISTSQPITSVCIISAKLARICAASSTATIETEILVTWNGTALSQQNVATSSTNGTSVIGFGSLYNKKAYLIGSASFVTIGYSNGYMAMSRRDRNATAVAELMLAHPYASAASTTSYSLGDQIGNGYFIRGIHSYVPSDPTVRPAIVLEYVDEFSCQRLATLRVTNTNFGGWLSLVMISPTLAIGQYRDASAANTYYTVAISVNIGAASPLGLYGPFVSGALGSGAFYSGGFFDNVDLYAVDYASLSTVAAGPYTIKLRRLIFNAANSGSELTTSTANDITVTFAAGLNLTSVPTVYYVSFYQDQMTLMYFGSTGVAGTTGAFIETFTLS